jgi:F-type H+-transporting ATPase subunit b
MLAPSQPTWYKWSFIRAGVRRVFGGPFVIPDLSVLWVVALVLLLTLSLNQLLFKPLKGVMAARESAVFSAKQLADAAAAQAHAANEEFDRQTRAARADVFGQMEEARRIALERRSQMLTTTRQRAESETAVAREQLRSDTAQARAALERDADSLAATIVERVLGRRAS